MSAEYLCNPLYYVEAMRHKHPQVLNDWCCTELSHVLDFSGSDGLGQVLAGVVDVRQGKTFVKKFSRNKQRANSQSGIFGAPLTEEGYRQARQLIDFLKDYITKEGIFRIPGNSERQRRLKDKINCGLLVDLENDIFTAHDVACVLKTLLGDLPEPLLTDRHYPAHVQAAGLTYEMDQVQSLTEEIGKRYQAKNTQDHITALRYLFLMLPPVNFKTLREILELLYCITEQENLNKMSAFNLGIMFAPHILWPRYLTTEDLRNQVLVNKLNCGVEFMITQYHKIFKVPAKMLKRCEQYIKHGRLIDEEEPAVLDQMQPQDECDSKSKTALVIGAPQTPNVEVKKEQNQTEAALAQLYASVQEMPPSSKKRKLMKQKHTEAPMHVKRRRAAPNPPAEHDDKIVQQRMNMRDTRHELVDQLQRNRSHTCTAPSTSKTTTAILAHPATYSECSVSPAKSRQKRKAPLTPKQREGQQLAAATKSSGVMKPVPSERSSLQSWKQQSDRPIHNTSQSNGSAVNRPVPKPRKLKENSQGSSVRHGSSHPKPKIGQKHELNSLV
ncbi:rho GTPase-activating protein 19-like isoform X2 [Patiria miniata]|uniref:Rho-GAP domain-containing protein n=1 Tax=Patiria miniata TaxID=46514 RepID=A0A914AK19_PATMI|nr:rho GTPase-activating protein 19-like isoform X2 [Patiria miniata]